MHPSVDRTFGLLVINDAAEAQFTYLDDAGVEQSRRVALTPALRALLGRSASVRIPRAKWADLGLPPKVN